MNIFNSVLLISSLALIACSDRPVGGNEIFSPIGGPTYATPRPVGDPYLTQGIGRLPPEQTAQATGGTTSPDPAGSFENTVAAAIENSAQPGTEISPQATTADPQPVQTAGVEPNAQSINLSESTQEEQKAQRAVAARELQAARDQLVIIQPDASSVPTANINVAEFARSTTNKVGQRVYQRTTFGSGQSTRSRCARFADADAAQRVFLQNGGPSQDRLKLDPDGDGFACKWSPEPYRALTVPGN